jgi:hypothetical protein
MPRQPARSMNPHARPALANSYNALGTMPPSSHLAPLLVLLSRPLLPSTHLRHLQQQTSWRDLTPSDPRLAISRIRTSRNSSRFTFSGCTTSHGAYVSNTLPANTLSTPKTPLRSLSQARLPPPSLLHSTTPSWSCSPTSSHFGLLGCCGRSRP